MFVRYQSYQNSVDGLELKVCVFVVDQATGDDQALEPKGQVLRRVHFPTTAPHRHFLDCAATTARAVAPRVEFD